MERNSEEACMRAYMFMYLCIACMHVCIYVCMYMFEFRKKGGERERERKWEKERENVWVKWWRQRYFNTPTLKSFGPSYIPLFWKIASNTLIWRNAVDVPCIIPHVSLLSFYVTRQSYYARKKMRKRDYIILYTICNYIYIIHVIINRFIIYII